MYDEEPKLTRNMNRDRQKPSDDNTLAYDFTNKPRKVEKTMAKMFPERWVETEPPQNRGKKIVMSKFDEDPRSTLTKH